MKRFTSIMLIAGTALFTMPAMSFAKTNGIEAAQQNTVVVVTGNGVRLRYAPSLSAGIYKNVSKGKRLTYRRTYGDWYEVYYDGHILYISRDFASLSTGSSSHSYSSSSSSAHRNYVKITGNGVRLRTSPNVYDNNIYTKVNKGVKLVHLGTYGDFYAVSYNGIRLFVSRDFASLSY